MGVYLNAGSTSVKISSYDPFMRLLQSLFIVHRMSETPFTIDADTLWADPPKRIPYKNVVAAFEAYKDIGLDFDTAYDLAIKERKRKDIATADRMKDLSKAQGISYALASRNMRKIYDDPAVKEMVKEKWDEVIELFEYAVANSCKVYMD